MIFDLYPQETVERLGGMRPVSGPEPGAFDNFFRGTGTFAMQGLAKAGRAVDMLGAIGPIAQDYLASNKVMRVTEAQDAYFREHDEVFNRAVDYWTPKPGEVGVAGEIAGQILSTLPLVIASPALAVGATQLSAGEDLVRKGVDAGKAGAVGAVQAAGLATGIWMPILGQNLWQRVVLGGAGFNLVQGVATRGASGMILEGTPAAEDFKAFDATALTLDLILGVAFGGLAHLSPAQRAQGAAMWERIDGWSKNLKPSEIDALVALRQAEHLNVDTVPGKPVDLQDVEAHSQRIRQAIDQLAQDKPVQIEDLPAAKVEADPQRQAEAARVVKALETEAQALAKAHDILPEPVAVDAPRPPEASTYSPEAAGIEPLQAEAARFVAENPDVAVTTGRNADGSPITTTLKQYLADADDAVRVADEESRLFLVAAACMLGAR